jgi:hypothetical protein
MKHTINIGAVQQERKIKGFERIQVYFNSALAYGLMTVFRVSYFRRCARRFDRGK